MDLARKRPRGEEEDHGQVKVTSNEPQTLPVPNQYLFESFPRSDLVRLLENFLYRWCAPSYEHVEVEMKLGFILSRQNTRYRLPIQTDAVLEPAQKDYRFQSSLPLPMFVHINHMMNKLTEKASKTKSLPRIRYQKIVETDRFYKYRGEKLRVTSDRAGKVLRAIQKKRLADLNILLSCGVDIRLSVNTETPVDAELARTCSLTNERAKERRSYEVGGLSVDMTEVKSTTQEVSYEIEVELADVSKLQTERDAYAGGNLTNFSSLVQVLRRKEGQTPLPPVVRTLELG
eukprot:Rmarinus@m.5411